MTTTNSPRIDLAELKARASGQWADIIASICGIDRSILDGNHHACPKCGGTDRFRMVDEAAGSLFCNQCFSKKNGDGIAAIQWLRGVDFAEALRLAAEHLRITPSATNGKPPAPAAKVYRQFGSPQLAVASLAASLGVPIAKWWEYKNERGVLVAFQTRFNLANGKKEFRPLSPHPKGGVAIKAPDGQRPLYRLPELLNAATVYVCEGEKSADAAVSIGLIATTSLNGAKSPKKTNWKPIKGKTVVILPDNDKPGRDYAETVAKLCREAGAASVKILELPVPNEGGDIVEWIETHGDAAEPDAIREELESLVAAQVPGSEKPVDSWLAISTDQGRTELGNARRFVATFGEDVRFCHAWSKWFCWDGTRWKLDDDGAVQRLAASIADAVWHLVANHHTKDTIEFAEKTSKASGINAMLKLAASMLPIRVDELDANHWLLNCPNGTVDLRIGALRPHRREDNLTKLCPTIFNPEAATLSFDHFLDSVFDGSSTLIDFLQRLFGYVITGDVREQCLPIFYGEGSNGKSTLLTAIQDTLGIDYSTTAPPSLLMEKKTDTHPTELAGLFGKRLVVAQETNQGARLAESTVKSLTGGDRVSARRMREDFWEFSPTHKLLLCTNHKPKIKGTDHAIWRRLLLVPFLQKFWNPDKGESGPDELRQDKTLPAKLKAEREGILAWMVQGCHAWQRDGLQVPDIVRTATEVYQGESDTVGRFVSECCLKGDSHRIKFSALFDALKKWCDELGNNLPSRTMVGAWLENRFERQLSSGTWYRGITTKPDLDENRNQFDPFEEAK